MRSCKQCTAPIPTESRTMKKSTYCSYECYLKFNGRRLKNMRKPLRKTVDKDELLRWLDDNAVDTVGTPHVILSDLVSFIHNGV